MKNRILELSMACLLILSFYILSREAVQTVRQAADTADPKVIVVDPGHGGSDPGMIGIGQLEEKKLNLEIALRLKSLLEKKGFSVCMTRETDAGLYDENSENRKAQDMQRRIALISEKQPVLTVSIHQNSYPDASVRGPQVFYYTDSVEGERLAQVLQECLNGMPQVTKPRQAKANKSYYLLKRSPGILNIIECGFLTNPQEAELLQTEEYQQQVAEAAAEGICRYLAD